MNEGLLQPVKDNVIMMSLLSTIYIYVFQFQLMKNNLKIMSKIGGFPP